MKPVHFSEQALVLGAPKDWDAEKHGPCGGLPVAFFDGGYVSHWRPSLKEVALLLVGYPLRLFVRSNGHPPVALNVRR